MPAGLAEQFEREAVAHHGQLLRTALKMTRHRQDAEDLVQETILRACAAYHQFTPGTNVTAWLHRIMLNTFINGYRKKRREPFLMVDDIEQCQVGSAAAILAAAAPSAEDRALSRIPDAALVAALSQLPDNFRQVMYLIDVEGFTYREVAAIMNTPLGTVMSRLHRARASMRAKLSERPNGVFEGPEQGERAGNPSQEVPHVQRDIGSGHNRGDSRHRTDRCRRKGGPAAPAAAAIRP
jgi:RNA polymerase sigma-70 factor (ECF subfamily)